MSLENRVGDARRSLKRIIVRAKDMIQHHPQGLIIIADHHSVSFEIIAQRIERCGRFAAAVSKVVAPCG